MRKSIGPMVVCGLLLSARFASAAGLGIGLDDFITTFLAFVTGLGMLLGVVGGTAWVASQFEYMQSSLLAGSVSWIFKAGMLGGLATICGVLGLASGALVP